MVSKKKAAAPLDAKRKLTVGKVSLLWDPRIYAAQVPKLQPMHKRILGIDMGTNCGVGFTDFVPGMPVVSAQIILGQWDLSIGKYDSGMLQHVRLKEFLSVLSPDLIIFEDVKVVPVPVPGMTVTALLARAMRPAEFLGGLKTTITVWAYERGIPCHGVGIGEIKKFATGRGNASKVEMIEAANARFGLTLNPEGYEESGVDNIADAAFVCDMGLQSYSRGLKDFSGKEVADVNDSAVEQDSDG